MGMKAIRMVGTIMAIIVCTNIASTIMACTIMAVMAMVSSGRI